MSEFEEIGPLFEESVLELTAADFKPLNTTINETFLPLMLVQTTTTESTPVKLEENLQEKIHEVNTTVENSTETATITKVKGVPLLKKEDKKIHETTLEQTQSLMQSSSSEEVSVIA